MKTREPTNLMIPLHAWEMWLVVVDICVNGHVTKDMLQRTLCIIPH